VPADGPLGIVLGTNDPSYLLYGPKLGRRLVRLPTQGAVRSAGERGLRWVLVSPDAGPIPVGGWHVQKASGGWQFLTRPSDTQPVSATVGQGCRPADVRHLATS
jgi:hypothetical protein